VVLVTLISLSVLAIILESIDSLYRQYETLFHLFEVLTVAVFSLEYVLRFWCSVECPDANRSGPFAGRLWHMLTPAAIIDLLAVLPFYLALGGLVSPADMRFLRAARLLRVLKLTRYSAAFDTLIQAVRENLRSFAAAFFVLVVVILLAATGMYYFEREAQPEAFASIPASMWWAFSTLTTVGYGDVTPVTAAGKVFGALITVVGVGMVALPTGILASAYTAQLNMRAEEYRRESDRAWADGVVTADEQAKLEVLRETLGLGEETAREILRSVGQQAALQATRREGSCPHCGAVRGVGAA
jgi:voltage-gated potassium channel